MIIFYAYNNICFQKNVKLTLFAYFFYKSLQKSNGLIQPKAKSNYFHLFIPQFPSQNSNCIFRNIELFRTILILHTNNNENLNWVLDTIDYIDSPKTRDQKFKTKRKWIWIKCLSWPFTYIWTSINKYNIMWSMMSVWNFVFACDVKWWNWFALSVETYF